MIAHLRRLPRAAADGSLALVVLHDTTALRRAERMRADFVANAAMSSRRRSRASPASSRPARSGAR